jgi:glycosyltransferase involved in cell wall biosynthesis
MYREPRLNDPKEPLVTVTLHNFNYGRYLRECLNSVYSQTYPNIEICFSDNASTDDSWEIALEYAQKYSGSMTLTQNRKNFGSDANFANCLLNARGKYLLELCSDDVLQPDFAGICVRALEAHQHVGFAMVHRVIIDENGERTEEPPFYKQSCIIPGPEQAAVYMMASVNPSISQIMYNRKMTYGKSVVGGIAGRWYGTRIMDFNMCCEFPMIYINQPLLLHRIHSQNDSLKVTENLMEIVGPYILAHQFAEIAANYNLEKVINRLPEAIKKLSDLALRYCIRSLLNNKEELAKRYYHLAAGIMPDISNSPIFGKIEEYWSANDSAKREIANALGMERHLISRTVAYEPPPGSIPLELPA